MRSMGGVGLCEAKGYSGFKGGEIFIIFAVEDLFFEEFPQSFDAIEVGRIAWQEEQFDV